MIHLYYTIYHDITNFLNNKYSYSIKTFFESFSKPTRLKFGMRMSVFLATVLSLTYISFVNEKIEK